MKKFLKDTSGNVAVTVALLGIPLMVSAGAAVDYTEFSRKRSSLQNATDAATIAVAHDLQTHSQAEVEAKVDAYLRSNLSAAQYAEIQHINVIIDPTKEKVTIQAEGEHPTALMRLAGISSLNYTPQSVVNVPTGNVEIVMVLDTTGSMSSDGKMAALKVSANQFVEDVLSANETRERAKIGIVPFNRYVNVGLDNRDASWMNVPDDYSVGDDDDDDNVTNYEWHGCAGSRNYPLNLNDENYNNKVPGILNVDCATRITELSTDENLLKNEINSFVASGSTYIPAGLVWGLRTLSSAEPFDDGLSYDEAIAKNTQKALVVMTDGQNQSSINPDDRSKHNGNHLVQANQYTREACTYIKNQGVVIYTIGFGTSIPQATLDLLKECSSDGVNYYNAADGAALSAAFSNITTQLANFYISK